MPSFANNQATSTTRLIWLSLLVVASTGCGDYSDASPAAYEYAKALYAITNRQIEDKLEGVSGKIETAHAAGKLSEREADWLEEIVVDARAGDWKSANQLARQIMEDQVEQ